MEKDIIIYQAISRAAARVFDHMIIEAGQYSADDVCKIFAQDEKQKKSGKDVPPRFPADFDDAEIIKISYDGYSCTFPAGAVFHTLKQCATAWNVPTAYRAKFIRKAETAPVAVAVPVSPIFKDVIKARIDKKDDPQNLRPVLQHVLIDTRRRAVIACNGHVLSAVPVSNMYVAPGANDNYIINADILKTGKGTLIIRENGNAENGGQTFPCFDGKYPRWETVCPAVNENNALYLGRAFKEIKKAIQAATKFSNDAQYHRVIIRAAAGADNVEIIGYRADYYDETRAAETKITKISLPQAAPFAFCYCFNGTYINAVNDADRIYFADDARPVIFAYPDKNIFALCMPVALAETPWHGENFVLPQDKEKEISIINVCRFPAENEENAPAAYQLITDEENDAQPANVADVADGAKIETITRNFVPVLDENIKNIIRAVAVDIVAPQLYKNGVVFGYGVLSANNISYDRFGRFFAAGQIIAAAQPENGDDGKICAVSVVFGPEAANVANVAQDEENDAPQLGTDEETPANVADVETVAPVAVADSVAVPQDEENDAQPETPAAVAAQITLIKESYLINGVVPGVIMQHKYDKNLFVVIVGVTNKGYKTKEIEIYPNSRRRAKVITKYYFKIDIQPGAKSLFSICPVYELEKVLAVLDPETLKIAAPAANVADVETVAPVAVPQDEETPANVAPVAVDRVAVADSPAQDENDAQPADVAPVAVSLPAAVDETLYNNIREYIKVYYQDETPETRAAYNYITLHGVKIIFGELYLHDNLIGKINKIIKDYICVSADIVFYQDEENDAPQLGTDEETPANVADVAPVAVSLPLPCFVENLHAVYLDGVLHGVYYSKLLADEEFYNLFFAGRDVYPLTFPASENAPRLLSDVITPANVAQDEETPANVANVADVETVAPVPVDSVAVADSLITFAAVPVSADSVAVPQDEETETAALIDTETAQNIEIAATGYMYEYSCTDEMFWAAVDYLRNKNIKIKHCKVYLNNNEIATIKLIKDNDGKCINVAVSYNAETVAPVAVADSVAVPQDEETETAAPFASLFAVLPEIPAQDEETPADVETVAPVAVSVPQDEETTRPSWERSPRARFGRRRARFAPWLIRAAAVVVLFIVSVFSLIDNAQKTPAAANVAPVPVDSVAVADSVANVTPVAVPQNEENDAPQIKTKRARRRHVAPVPADSVAVADSLITFAAVPVSADSVAVADSLITFAAVPVSADSVAVADSVANVAPVAVPQDEENDAPQLGTDKETPANVANGETVAPVAVDRVAVADSPAQDENDAPGAPDNVPQPAPADNVPAVVPVVTISAPAAPVSPVIDCVLNHSPATL